MDADLNALCKKCAGFEVSETKVFAVYNGLFSLELRLVELCLKLKAEFNEEILTKSHRDQIR